MYAAYQVVAYCFSLSIPCSRVVYLQTLRPFAFLNALQTRALLLPQKEGPNDST